MNKLMSLSCATLLLLAAPFSGMADEEPVKFPEAPGVRRVKLLKVNCWIGNAALTRDGRWLVVSCVDSGKLFSFDTTTWAESQSVTESGNTGILIDSVSEDGRKIVAHYGHTDKFQWTVDVSTGKVEGAKIAKRQQGYDKILRASADSPAVAYRYGAMSTRAELFYSPGGNEPFHSVYVKHPGTCCKLLTTADMKTAYFLPNNGALVEVDMQSGTAREVMSDNRWYAMINDQFQNTAALTRDGKYLATISPTSTEVASLVTDASHRIAWTDKTLGLFMSMSLKFDPDERHLIISCGFFHRGCVQVLDMNTMKDVLLAPLKGDAKSVIVSDDNRRLIYASEKGYIYIWNLEDATPDVPEVVPQPARH